jgi:putative transcriptional regulator
MAGLDTRRTPEVLSELGDRIQKTRIQQEYSQAALAERAGVGIATLQRMESGRGGHLETFIKVLRALRRLDALDALLPEPEVSPLHLARHGKPRERVRKRRG